VVGFCGGALLAQFLHNVRVGKSVVAIHTPLGARPEATVAPRLVLVVDDDPSIRILLAECLRDEPGVRTALARDGREAIERIAAEQPALLLLDLGMPGLDGIEVIRRLRADRATPALQIVAMSAGERAETALEAGADAFVAKPFDLDRLCAVLRERLARAGAPHA
jgi:CheY-like chemotaxis protein